MTVSVVLEFLQDNAQLLSAAALWASAAALWATFIYRRPE